MMVGLGRCQMLDCVVAAGSFTHSSQLFLGTAYNWFGAWLPPLVGLAVGLEGHTGKGLGQVVSLLLAGLNG